jgi:hypothetical protein
MVEVASLPVLDIWRVKETKTNVITMEWLGPIGLSGAIRNIVRAPEVVKINPPRLMREFWTPKGSDIVKGVVAQAKTARDAMPVTASSATVRRSREVVDPPPSASEMNLSKPSPSTVCASITNLIVCAYITNLIVCAYITNLKMSEKENRNSTMAGIYRSLSMLRNCGGS